MTVEANSNPPIHQRRCEIGLAVLRSRFTVVAIVGLLGQRRRRGQGKRGEVRSAEGAEYESQGQARSEAERVAPGCVKPKATRPERPKYPHRYYALSGLIRALLSYPGATRFALAPGYHIPRLRRYEPLRACPGFHIPPLRRFALAPGRAFGATNLIPRLRRYEPLRAFGALALRSLRLSIQIKIARNAKHLRAA